MFGVGFPSVSRCSPSGPASVAFVDLGGRGISAAETEKTQDLVPGVVQSTSRTKARVVWVEYHELHGGWNAGDML